jgi:hypothetical protein
MSDPTPNAIRPETEATSWQCPKCKRWQSTAWERCRSAYDTGLYCDGVRLVTYPSPPPSAGSAEERLRDALQNAQAFIGVMFGDKDGNVPERVMTPLGIHVKLGEIWKVVNDALTGK